MELGPVCRANDWRGRFLLWHDMCHNYKTVSSEFVRAKNVQRIFSRVCWDFPATLRRSSANLYGRPHAGNSSRFGLSNSRGGNRLSSWVGPDGFIFLEILKYCKISLIIGEGLVCFNLCAIGKFKTENANIDFDRQPFDAYGHGSAFPHC
jgi:hypothetical protein